MPVIVRLATDLTQREPGAVRVAAPAAAVFAPRAGSGQCSGVARAFYNLDTGAA